MIERLGIPEVFVYRPRRFADDRGWFSETYSLRGLTDALGDLAFVQDNQSFSSARHTLRGLHFQVPPRAQDKLVRVLRGAVLDVAVDIRRGSPSFGRAVSALLTAEGGEQIFVPKGFAHAFLTLEPDTEVFYKVSDFYSKEHERGLAWDDPALAVDWGVPAEAVTIAARDAAFPRLADLPVHFQFAG